MNQLILALQHFFFVISESQFEEMSNPLLPTSKEDSTNSPKVIERSNPYQQRLIRQGSNIGKINCYHQGDFIFGNLSTYLLLHPC